MATRCGTCGSPVPARDRGRPARYCSPACKAKAYRARKRGPADTVSPAPRGPQAVADALWRDVLALVKAARARQEGREVDAATIAAAAAAARQSLDDLVARAHHPAPAVARMTGLAEPATARTAPRAPRPADVTKTRECVTKTREADRPGPSGRLQAVRELGPEWRLDADDVLWRGTGRSAVRIGSVRRAGLSGGGWEARHASGSAVTTGAGPRGRYPSRLKALTALAAEADRAHREHTPHTEVPVEGLPEGWRLTQTLADRDDGQWRLHAPGGQVAGTLTRETYGGRRAEWRATAGDPANRTALRTAVTPATGDPDRGSDFDLFRTRAGAARALADWHDPDLTGL
ncbi:hypothetical protein [Actinomadura coerulea]|uniref:hypothetical protein n=1 Tax=Actinomadura coerulea TaxID=46159 RepID=UPI00341E1530